MERKMSRFFLGVGVNASNAVAMTSKFLSESNAVSNALWAYWQPLMLARLASHLLAPWLAVEDEAELNEEALDAIWVTFLTSVNKVGLDCWELDNLLLEAKHRDYILNDRGL